MKQIGSGKPGARTVPTAIVGNWRRLYLLRHGEVAYFDQEGRPADPWQARLTENGTAQAAALGEALARCGVELLLTSAVPRALETSAILAARLGLTPVVDTAWNELRPGDLAAVPREQLHAVIVNAYRRADEPGACFFGGEAFADFAARIDAALLRLLAAPGWRNAVLVTHEPVLRWLVARGLGLGLSGMRFFEQEPGCVNVIEFSAMTGEPLIRLLNGAPGDLGRLAARGPALDRFHQRYSAARGG